MGDVFSHLTSQPLKEDNNTLLKPLFFLENEKLAFYSTTYPTVGNTNICLNQEVLYCTLLIQGC